MNINPKNKSSFKLFDLILHGKYVDVSMSLFLVGICILFNIVISHHYFHTAITGTDQSTYNGIALALLHGTNLAKVGNFTIDIGQEVTPFYSAFVAFTYYLHPSIYSLIILQVILNCASILLLFASLKILTQNKILSFFIALVFIFYFPLWGLNFYVMMEVPTVFLISLIIYLLVVFFRTNTIKNLYQAVAVFSFLVLMNNRFIVLFGVLFLFIAYLTFKKPGITIIQLSIAALISILVISPWFVRQYNTYHQFVFFTPLWHNVLAKNNLLVNPIPIVSIEDQYEAKNVKSYEEYSQQLINSGYPASKLMTKEKYLLVLNNNNGKIYTERLLRYFTLYERDYNQLYSNSYTILPPSSLPFCVIQLVILLPLFLFSLAGAIIAFVKKDKFIILLVMFSISHICLHILINYIDRYRLSILPVLILLAAFGIYNILPIFFSNNIYSKNERQNT